jgi:DNA-directed RNA polymerase specialized sigma24 family protein
MSNVSRIEPLYTFAVYMLGSREEAFGAVCDAMEAQPNEPANWLAHLVARLVSAEKKRRVDHFAALDDILRTHTTIPVDLEHPLVRGDARRLDVLLSELQRTCLMTTLRGLPPERRAVFILVHLLELSFEACAAVVGSTPSAVKITDGRARRSLEGYLGTRCEHMDAGNSCRCISRLGNALEHGLVVWPNHKDHDRASPASDVYSEAGKLYASLPRVRLPVVP